MDIQLSQMLFQAVNFFAVTGALTYLLYKPVLKVFEERAQRIQEGQRAAEEAIKGREELDSLRADTQTKLKQERANILKKAQEEAEQRKSEILAQAKNQADQERSKLLSEWQREKAQLVRENEQEMVDAVISAAQSVVNKSLSEKDQVKLAQTELSTLIKNI